MTATERHRRAERREALTRGSGFHAFKDVPAPWRAMILRRCAFCQRGPKDLDGLFALDGLPGMTRLWCCTACAKGIVET